MSQRFSHLFSPVRIGAMTVKNRIALSPHHSLLFDADTQLPGERVIAYWVAKAKGGVGLLVGDTLGTHRTSWWHPFRSPGAVAAFKKGADAVHQYDTRIVAQLFHTGGVDIPRVIGRVTWAPSPIPSPRGWQIPHEMTVDEIKDMIESFANAAARIRESGWDGVELHGAHGYLINQFMSPFFNRRTDDYGGSLENRMRFALEMIDAVRSAAGKDFPLGMRVNGDEFIEGGYTLDDFLVMAPMLAKPGRVDYLSISAGSYRTPMFASDTTYSPLSSIVYLSAAIKKVVSVPVFTRGRIIDPLQAEEIIANNQADMVTMCRALVADPEWPNKALEGRPEEIRPCITCNEGCFARVTEGFTLSCSMNPTVGRENQRGWLEPQPATRRKTVMVIGGGPAGLETARVAALRGHNVSLYERGSELGGLTLLAGKAPGRESYLDLSRYYISQMKVLGVNVYLGTQVTSDMVRDKNPDVVVVATGSVPFIPEIAGGDQDNVVEARDVLAGMAQVGQKVVLFAGDQHMQALTTADFLATQGKQVEVLCEEYSAGSQVEISTRAAVIERLYRNGVTFSPCTALKEISGNTVVAVNVLTGQERLIEGVDTVVMACGGKENATIFRSLKGQFKELFAVGDCAGVRRLPDATMDGAKIGRVI